MNTKELDVTNKNLAEDFNYTASSGINGYSNAFGDNIKNAINSVKDAIKKQDTKIKSEIKDNGLLNTFNNKTQKFNPAAVVPRSSALVGVRYNVFGLATRLYPAFLSESELKSRNFNLDNANKAKDAWAKVQKAWRNLGGDPAALEKEIKKGYDKPVFKTKAVKARKEAESKFSGFYGYPNINYLATVRDYNGVDYLMTRNGDIDTGWLEKKENNLYRDEFSNYTGAEETAAYISIGVGILGVLSSVIDKVGASKNPYDAKQIDTTGMTAPPLTPEQQTELDKITEAAKNDLANGKGLDSGTDLPSDTIMGLPKTAFWIGLGAIVLIGGIVTYKIIKNRKK